MSSGEVYLLDDDVSNRVTTRLKERPKNSKISQMSDSEFIDGAADIFEEPEGFRPPPPQAHFAEYERTAVSPESDSQLCKIPLRLVGESPLWGHLLWNAGIYTAKHLDKHAELVKGKKVLELGAAGALPSLVAALIGARKVVSTDYPDADLLANIEYNVDSVVYDAASISDNRIVVEGYIWGNDYLPLQKHIGGKDSKFDLIILSDLVFNHTEHNKLLRTVKDLLAVDGKALVVFSPHRPWLLEKDLKFFETCQEFGLASQLIEMVNWKPMFDNDPGSVEIRSRVYAYYLAHI